MRGRAITVVLAVLGFVVIVSLSAFIWTQLERSAKVSPRTRVPGSSEVSNQSDNQTGMEAGSESLEYKIARKDLQSSESLIGHINDLSVVAKHDFEIGNIKEAKKYALELLDSTKTRRPHDYGAYGTAVHDGNLVLGRIALRNGNVKLADRFLLEAGLTSGSPVLDSFGPNMSLAKDLSDAGQSKTVVQYFHECAQFWILGRDNLKEWESEVQAGVTPDFGSNLRN